MAAMTINDILAELGKPDGVTFQDLLRHMHTIDPDKVAVEFEGKRHTYAETLSRVAGAATYLRSLGVKQGDHVAYMLLGHPNAVAVYLAVVGMGAVAVPVYRGLEGDVLVKMLDRYDVDVFVVDPDLDPLPEGWQKDLPGLGTIVSSRNSELDDAIQQGGEISELLSDIGLTPSTPAAILSTSGTTGVPKGVVQPHSFVVMGHIMCRNLGLDPTRAYFAGSWGHGVSIFDSTAPFWIGGTVIIAPRFSASRFWEEVYTTGSTYTRMIGSMPRMLMKQPENHYEGEHKVRAILTSGMPADIWEDFEKRFSVKVLEGYSGTDLGGAYLMNDGRFPAGSLGRPTSDFEVRIIDSVDRDVAAGESGELLIRPAHGAARVTYYNDETASKEKVTSDGWVRTGDAFRMDSDGNLYFVDRLRDVIRRRGINIAPAAVEEGLSGHPGVTLVAAFAVPSELGEDEIKVIAIAIDDNLRPEALFEHAQQHLPSYMVPRYIELVDALPLTAGTGKIRRAALKQNWRTPTTWDSGARDFLSPAAACAQD